MPPAYIKPYLKRSKNDAIDAAAISEACRAPICGSSRSRAPISKPC